MDLYRAGDARLTGEALIGGLFAFVAAWITVALLMKWLQRYSYTPFVFYRLSARHPAAGADLCVWLVARGGSRLASAPRHAPGFERQGEQGLPGGRRRRGRHCAASEGRPHRAAPPRRQACRPASG